MRVRHPPARPWRRRVAAGMGMGRKAPVVNSVEVIGLWLSFPNYLARSWPSIISVPELESLCLFYTTCGRRSRGTWFLLGSTSPARLPEGRRGVDGSMEESQESSAVARRLPGPIARSRVLSSEFPRVLEAQT